MDNGFREYLSGIITQLRGRLPEYLAAHGITPNDAGWFRCFHPEHNDHEPSAHIIPYSNDESFLCFSCQASGSIFDAAYWLENFPTHGKPFLTETIPALCSRFGIPYTPPELSAYDLLQMSLYQLFKDAEEVLLRTGNFEYAAKRGWSDETIHKFGVGTITDFNAFRQVLIDQYGYSMEELAAGEITAKLFGSNRLTFTIKDHWGRPVGFAARKLDWVKGDSEPKYRNTSNAVPIYHKDELLYGMHIARRSKKAIILTEGYADVITAHQAGYTNVVACCGTSVTSAHVDVLRACSVSDLILAFDYDPVSHAGSKAMLKAIDYDKDGDQERKGVLAGLDWLRLRICDISRLSEYEGWQEVIANGYDIDNMLGTSEGRAAFDSGQLLVDAFEWRLAQFQQDVPVDRICDKVLPLVVNEQSNPRRELMLRALAERTGLQFRTLDRELQTLLDQNSRESLERIEDARLRLLRRLRGARTGEVASVVSVGLEELRAVTEVSISEDAVSSEETVNSLAELRQELELAESGLTGAHTGFERLNEALNGIPLEDRMILIAAPPNAGKSSMIGQLVWNILRRNYADNIGVIVFTTDDSRKTFFKRLLSLESGLPTGLVSQPVRIIHEQNRENLNQAWEYLRWFVQAGFLHVKDNSHGQDLAFFEKWYQQIHEQYPNRRFIAFIDNFHKLQGPEQDERLKFKKLSQTIHRWKTEKNMTFICTAELRKTDGKRPSLDDLAETVQLRYDCDLGLMYQNDMNDKYGAVPDPEAVCWLDGEIQKPIISLEFQKNKVTDFKGAIRFRFDPPTGRHYEVEADTMFQQES